MKDYAPTQLGTHQALFEHFKQWLMANDFDYPYSPRSLDAYVRTVGQFLQQCQQQEIISLREVNSAILRSFIKFKADGSKYAINSMNIRTAALNLFFAWAMDNAYTQDNPLLDYQATEKERKQFGGRGGRKPVRLPSVLSLAELDRLSDCIMPGENFNQVRDAFLITLILATGIRTEEITRLKVEQFHFEQKYFIVLGKGNKERLVKFHSTSLCETTYPAYQLKRETQLNKLKTISPYLFITNRGKPMTTRLVYQQISHYLTQAEVNTERRGGHTLRHTAASLLLNNNVPITFIQQNFGHDDLKTTIRYLHLIRHA
ncbi:MAG: integrase family protein [Gammaproteobacteria bacterium]|jgi:site-specific recombinase XerD|nr:integrase family protein [Gammaproteobacteria bacterium]